VFIARPGIEIARDTSRILSDRIVIPEEDIRRRRDGRAGGRRLPSNPHARLTRSHVLDLHLWFDGNTTLHEAHRLSHVVKDRLMQTFPQIADAIIHIEPPPS
jgi:divalent metal cation (Fe/Co/Zn/Cd) transporter